MFSLICALKKRLSKNHEAGDLRRHRAHYDVIVMWKRLSLGKYCLSFAHIINRFSIHYNEHKMEVTMTERTRKLTRRHLGYGCSSGRCWQVGNGCRCISSSHSLQHWSEPGLGNLNTDQHVFFRMALQAFLSSFVIFCINTHARGFIVFCYLVTISSAGTPTITHFA